MDSLDESPINCELWLLARYKKWGRCGPDIHQHHLINKSKMRSSPEALKFAEAHWEIWGADVCDVHNVSRFADTPAAQAWLLDLRMRTLGPDYVASLWEEWLSKFKVHYPEFEIDAILAGFPKIA